MSLATSGRIAALSVGDEVPPESWGPLRIDQFVRFCMAGGVPEPGQDLGAVHYDPWFAKSSGLKDVVDMGAWRTALFIQVAQRWGGPQARVRKISNRYGDFVYRGEVMRFCGRIVAKRVGDEAVEFDLDIWNDKEVDGTRKVVTTGSLTLSVPVVR